VRDKKGKERDEQIGGDRQREQRQAKHTKTYKTGKDKDRSSGRRSKGWIRQSQREERKRERHEQIEKISMEIYREIRIDGRR